MSNSNSSKENVARLACAQAPLPSLAACKVHLVSTLVNLLNPFKIHTMTEIAAGVSTRINVRALLNRSFERESEFSLTPVTRTKTLDFSLKSYVKYTVFSQQHLGILSLKNLIAPVVLLSFSATGWKAVSQFSSRNSSSVLIGAWCFGWFTNFYGNLQTWNL